MDSHFSAASGWHTATVAPAPRKAPRTTLPCPWRMAALALRAAVLSDLLWLGAGAVICGCRSAGMAAVTRMR